MSSDPQVRPLPSALPRLWDGDLVQGDESAWMILGDTPGSQSRQRVKIPPGWAESVFRLTDADLQPLAVVDGSRAPLPLTLEKTLQQVQALTGQPWPAPPACDDAVLKTDEAKLSQLRDALMAKTNELVKVLATQDPANQLALTKQWMVDKAAKDKEVMTALSATSAAASAIPLVGPVLAAMLNIVAAVGGGVALGPSPQNASTRELFNRISYRGFSGFLYSAEHPPSGDDWDAVGRSIDSINLQFITWVDSTLETLSKALRLPFKCIFPAWWEPRTLTPPTPARLREMRFQAARFATEPGRFRAQAALDMGAPRYLIEFLPDPNSEAIAKLLLANSRNQTPKAWAESVMKKP